MSSTTTLDLANYTTVWQDNFAADTQLNTNLFPVAWGDGDEFSFGSGGLTLTSDGNAAGFMNADYGNSSGYGYGLYSVTFTESPDQSPGAYICLWPGSNVWPGPEIDFVEQYDGQTYYTVHWEGAGDTNQYQSYFFTANVGQPTTLSLDWEANSLTFYVNGKEAVQYLAGGAVPIPQDYADGGENESFGVGNVGPAGTAITIESMSYSAYTPGAAASDPSTTISVSSPGTVQEASAGAGVNVTETISDKGLTEAYYEVRTSAGAAEGGWTEVTLSSAGTATISVHFDTTGDYLYVANATADATDTGKSAAVTITNPATVTPSTTISVSSPGTVQEASAGAGVNVTETISDKGLAEAYYEVRTSAGAAEGGWTEVTLSSAGAATFSVHFDSTGDYLYVANATADATDTGKSAAVTITNDPATVTPSKTISVSSPGTVQEASAGAGVNVTETISDKGLAEAYYEVRTSAGAAEGGWTEVTLSSAGTATFSVHFDTTGDYLYVANATADATDTGKSAAVTITNDPATVTPSTWITVSNPGTVQEASKGAGVTKTITVSDPGLNVIYAAVFDSANVAEESWIPITLNAAGAGSFSAHFENSGDYVVAVNNTATQTDKGWSDPIAITDPATASITLSKPGTVEAASAGAAVNVTETVTATDLSKIYYEVVNSAGTAEGAWTGVTLSSAGTASFSAHFEHTGDYVVAVNNTATPTVKALSAPITITEPSSEPATPTDIALTGDNLTNTSTAWTVIGTLSCSDSHSIATWALGVDPDGLFSIDSNKLLLNQNMPADPASSYQVGIIAEDSTGAIGQTTVTVDVKAATAATASSMVSAATVATAAAQFTFSTGVDATVTAVANETFTYHAGDGLDTIKGFSAASGDVLDIDKSLQGSLTESVSGGSTLLAFGAASHGIVLQGVSSFNTAQIHWI